MSVKFIKSLKGSGAVNLVGKVLVATPSLDESVFERSLIFICAHDEEGTIGVIINKPVSQITTQDIVDKFNLKKRFKINRKYTIYTGGPVDEDKLFILSLNEKSDDTQDTAQLTLYSNANAFLVDVVKGENSNKFIACNGFCGWGQHQLEQEINDNSWIITEANYQTIFTGEPGKKWTKIIKQLGIKNPERLVPYSGNA